jgi:predicted ATP-grasp superfamily ATP-dependent carboligase
MSAHNLKSVLAPAIVLGADSPIGLTVVRELGLNGVPVIAIGRNRFSLGRYSRFTRHFFLDNKEQPLSKWLPDIITQTASKILFAVSEGDLLELADLPEVIEGCRILTPRRRQLEIVLDKSRTFSAARAVGIDVPESWQPSSNDNFAERAESFPYPAILKWSDPPSMWVRLREADIPFEKINYARSPSELLALLRRYNKLGCWPLVQPWCTGYGLGQMLMMCNGKAQLRFQHRRLREFPAAGGVSTLCASVSLEYHAEQLRKSEALLANIGWEGPAMVEYRHDPNGGRYWLMEINGRFWGSLPLASQSGAQFAWEQYRNATLHDFEAADSGYRLRRARYIGPDAKRLFQIIRSPAEAAAPGQPVPRRLSEFLAFFGEFVNPRTGYYVWDWTDPQPFFGDLFGAFVRRAHLERFV